MNWAVHNGLVTRDNRIIPLENLKLIVIAYGRYGGHWDLKEQNNHFLFQSDFYSYINRQKMKRIYPLFVREALNHDEPLQLGMLKKQTEMWYSKKIKKLPFLNNSETKHNTIFAFPESDGNHTTKATKSVFLKKNPTM